jgi:RNA polymerase sigma factor (sigma-70 family)
MVNPSSIKQIRHFSPPTEECEVWKDLLEGDKKALAHIYTKYFDKLYNYGSRISNDAVIVEDSIQDLFITIWNLRTGLNHNVKNIKQYLYTCLRRNILLKLRNRHVTVGISELAAFDLELSHKSHYLNNRINTELREKLTEMVGTLTPKQKEAIFLIYFDELSYEEAASIMSLKIKTVYNLVHQAISRLKERKHVFWHLISFVF